MILSLSTLTTLAHPIHPHMLPNKPYQHILSTNPVNTPCQHTLSTHPVNTPCQHTLSTHPVNTPYQHTLSTHPINTPSPNAAFDTIDADPPRRYSLTYPSPLTHGTPLTYPYGSLQLRHRDCNLTKQKQTINQSIKKNKKGPPLPEGWERRTKTVSESNCSVHITTGSPPHPPSLCHSF